MSLLKRENGNRKLSSWGTKHKDEIECNICDFMFLQHNLNLENERDIDEVYDIKDKLGAGTYGTVRVAVHKTTKLKRAVKSIFKGLTTKSEESQIANEMRILQLLSHTNILPLIEYFETDVRLYIVTDIYEGGELFDEIIRRGDFDEKGAATIIKQLISCLSYLSKKKIIHRDLKPENILLTKTKDLEAIKVIDFGHAIEFDPDNDKPLTKRVGTPFYISPEVLNGSYDNRTDLWSTGVIAYILLCGAPPFGGHDNDEIFSKVKQGKYAMKHSPWPEVSETAKDFVRSILVVDRQERSTLEDLQEHDFLGLSSKRGSINEKRRGSAGRGKLSVLGSGLGSSFEKAKDAINKRAMKKKENKAVNNLKKFRCRYKFGQVVFAYVITQCMSKEAKEEMAQVFRSWDENNDGLLTRKEMRKGIETSAPKVGKVFDLDHWFDLMDIDCNGYVEYHEFLMMATDKKIMTKKNLNSVFEFLDKDSSGFIELNELREALKEFDDTEVVILEMLNEVDVNSDGKISKEEFLNLLSTDR